MKGEASFLGLIYKPSVVLRQAASNKPVFWSILLYLSLPVLFFAIERVFFSDSHSLWGLFVNRNVNMAVRMETLSMVLPFLSIIGVMVYCSARIFGGKGSFVSSMCTHAFSLLPLFLTFPLIFIANSIILGWPIDYSFYGIYLWHAALAVLAVRETHGFKTSQSIFVFLLALVLTVVLVIIIAFTYHQLFWENPLYVDVD